ncbi:uncharacterized protein LOC141685528 [Apium graveolens]|uniref:uncharacterized protein LOC141685528 n=1 Tax=Apium graveolens TaxID=4045 RepID=UPI003D7A7555
MVNQGKIVLPVASSVLASLLVEGGRIAHSRFKIPIDIDEFSCCNIKKNTHLAELICKTNLLVWDEAPMNHHYVFEVVDRTFCDILSKRNPKAASLPFGGMTMLLGGDFRQTLPVVPKMGREATVNAKNMRVDIDVPPITVDGVNILFRDWVLSAWLQVTYDGDPMCAIVNEIYGDLNVKQGDITYLRNRAILAPLNENVKVFNQEVLKRLPGDSRIYTSCDTICKGSTTSDAAEALYPAEYLNSLKFSGLPNHQTELKIGAPILLLRNLNPNKGLCNGTRLIVTRYYPFVIEAVIITGL